MLEKFTFRYRVVYNAGCRLHRCNSIGDDAGADRDCEIHSFDGGRDIPDSAAVWAAPFRLHLIDDFHRANFRCTGERARGEAGAKGIHGGQAFAKLAVDLAHEMQHVRVSLDDHQLTHVNRSIACYTADVVAAKVDEHEMLGALLFVS